MILILEDDPGVAHLERARLLRAGYKVKIAETAPEARRLLEEGGTDLMVLDHRLKGGASGLDFHRELREARLEVPSILVTGFGDSGTLLQALRAGVRDFLPKTPDYLDYLVPTVERVLTQVQTERQLKNERDRRIAEQAARSQLEIQRAALAESESRFRVLAQAIPQLVWSCRPDGYTDFCNEQWSEYTGQSPEESYGAGWLEVVHPDDLPTTRNLWRRALRERQSFQTDCRLRRASDGRYRWHLSRAWPQRDEAGEVVRWFGTCTDIDDQKQAEESLKEADRKKDEFLAMLAHELRNPLAAIRHAVALLRGPVDPADRDWAVGVVDRQGRNLTRLIDDLLDVSRIATGKFQLRRERIDATRLAREAVETVRPFAEEKAHTLVLEIDPGPIWVDADPTRLEQIFVNLLTNAAKYTDEGGRITFLAAREKDDLVIRVRDTGLGIPAGMLPRIFDLFTQVEGSIERAHGGLGIGLTLVRTLVTMHGGRIRAESEGVGKGSEFTVWIPTAEPDLRDADRGLTARADANPHVRKRVLVVDDNEDSSRSLSRLLTLAGHETEVAADGRSAVEAARRFRPDVVLLDIRLPDIDGYELAERLRSERGFEKVAIVAITGMNPSRPPERAHKARIDHHLTKPVEVDRLLAIINDREPRKSPFQDFGTPNA
jgi:two-component system CheB/CheR fusion protein